VNWEYLQKGDAVFDRFSHLLPELAKSRNANAIIQVKFNGSKIGLLDIMGPSSCFINVTVNNSDPKLYKRFDQSCTWCRINYFTVDEIKKQGIYSVTFEVSDEHFNKKEILLENAENKDIELNDEYKSYDYYTGYIMLIGKIVPN